MNIKVMLLLLLFLLGTPNWMNAQRLAPTIEDATRYTMDGMGIGARAAGMGFAYTSVANDFSAIYFNPAGLAQLKKIELSATMDASFLNTTSSYLGDVGYHEMATVNINNVSGLIPLPSSFWNVVLALGFHVKKDFLGVRRGKFQGTDESQTIATHFFQSFEVQCDSDNLLITNDYGRLAYETYLQDVTSDCSSFENPILADIGNVTISEVSKESGRLYQVAFGIGLEPIKNLFIGATVSYLFGNYFSTSTYEEIGDPPKHEYFTSLELDNNIRASISGWAIQLGVLYQVGNAKFGINIDVPSTLSFDDEKSSELRVSYKKDPPNKEKKLDSSNPLSEIEPIKIAYQFHIPLSLSVGASYFFEEVLLASIDVEYQPYTSGYFTSSDETLRVTDINTNIKNALSSSRIRVSGGVEYSLKKAPIVLRGGVSFLTYPYRFRRDRTSPGFSEAEKKISVGLGYFIAEGFLLNVALSYAWGSSQRVPYAWRSDHLTSLYDKPFSYDGNSRIDILLGISYRF